MKYLLLLPSKDHKTNFLKQEKCRLLNSSKSNIGKVRKHILDNINSTFKNKCGLVKYKVIKTLLMGLTKSNSRKTKHFKI